MFINKTSLNGDELQLYNQLVSSILQRNLIDSEMIEKDYLVKYNERDTFISFLILLTIK
jgi:hypothetical protein